MNKRILLGSSGAPVAVITNASDSYLMAIEQANSDCVLLETGVTVLENVEGVRKIESDRTEISGYSDYKSGDFVFGKVPDGKGGWTQPGG